MCSDQSLTQSRALWGDDAAVSYDIATSLRIYTTPDTMSFVIQDDLLGGMQMTLDPSSGKKL
jgi:hypothetical protein